MKTKTPNLDSAAVTARVISRLLKKAGFRMADTSDRYRWTEGFHVSRVGYSRHVQVDYHNGTWNPMPEQKQKRRDAMALMAAFLTERGYVRDETIGGYYIACKSD